MFFAEKRMKLSDQSSIINNKKKSDPLSISSIDPEKDSDYMSQRDFTESSVDFSLPSIKRKNSTSGRASKQSFELADLHQSSGYSSLVSSSLSSPRKSLSRTPKKRKFDDTGSDENAFYNSEHFVSPVKLRKNEPSGNRAKLVLKEKSSSENVILSSTPIRDANRKKLWGKSRSLHPERFDVGRSLDYAEAIPKPPVLPKTSEISFNYGCSFDFTESFDLTSNVEHPDGNIPSNVEQLWTGSLKRETSPQPQAAAVKSQATETVTKSQEQTFSPNLVTPRSTRKFYDGRTKLDICGKLHMENNLALDKIFSHFSDVDLLSLSHVSKDYKHMIKSNKTWETKRRNYLNTHRINKENKLLPKPVAAKSCKRAFADSNINHSMELRSKQISPPVSPSTKRFRDIQKIAKSYSGELRKCPRCNKPAKISTVSIRTSPRKRKNRSILKVSARGRGRVQKQNKTFLSKPSIDSYPLANELYVTFPNLDDNSGSNSTSSSCASPASPSTDDSCASGNESGRDIQTCDFGECSGVACRFKFCVKCNCKFHPRQSCKDFSVASPSRGYSNNSSVACTRQSTKKLKRLTDYF